MVTGVKCANYNCGSPKKSKYLVRTVVSSFPGDGVARAYYDKDAGRKNSL